MQTNVVDPEDIVHSLTSAIQNQLQMIQEQTRMLTMMQTELHTITQSGTSERQSLLNEKDQLKQREQELLRELDQIRHRMEQVEQALEENQKKKAERINSITQNNFVASLLGAPPQETRPQPGTRNSYQK